MKLSLLLCCLLLAASTPDCEATRVRGLAKRTRGGARQQSDRVPGAVGGAISRHMDVLCNTGRHRGKALSRGKRSALTLNQVDDVNAVDIATTFNLDFTSVQEVFDVCDTDMNESLDGQEVLVFLGMIERLSSSSGNKGTPMKFR